MPRQRDLMSGKCNCSKCAKKKEILDVKYRCVDCKKKFIGKYFRRGEHYPMCYNCYHPEPPYEDNSME